MTFVYALGAVAIVSLVSFSGLVAIAMREAALKRVVFLLVGLAAGSLFGDALLHLIPEVLESGMGEIGLGIAVMSGILFFFALEKFLYWHHCHGEHEENEDTLATHSHESKPLGALVLTADFVHNAIDGVIIGTSFLIGPEVGVATTVAVILHEIPQEIGDFGVLVYGGFSKLKALYYNFVIALTCILGTVIGYFISANMHNFSPFLLPFTAGGFIYIAVADLIPELHKNKEVGTPRMGGIVIWASVFITVAGLWVLEKWFGGKRGMGIIRTV